MKAKLLIALLLVALAAPAVPAAVPPAAAAGCLSARDARSAVASGEAMRLGEVAGLVEGDIVNAELCERGRRLVWQLAVIRRGGKVVTVTVDAQSGRVLR